MSRRSNLDRGSCTGLLVNEAYEDLLPISIHIDELLALAAAIPDLNLFTVAATEDAGDGTVWGDMNATNFTGHEHASKVVLTALDVFEDESLRVTHKNILYDYVGIQPVLLGAGGNKTLIAADFEVIPGSPHESLQGRDAVDSHPISAIT